MITFVNAVIELSLESEREEILGGIGHGNNSDRVFSPNSRNYSGELAAPLAQLAVASLFIR